MSRNLFIPCWHYLTCRKLQKAMVSSCASVQAWSKGNHHCRASNYTRARNLLSWSCKDPGVLHNVVPIPLFNLTNNTRFLCNESNDSDSDDEIFYSAEKAIDDKDLKNFPEDFRNTLYPDSRDPLLIILNESKNVHDVFNFMHKNHSSLNSMLTSQIIIVLWDLQRVFWNVCSEHSPEDNISQLKGYIRAVSGHPDFECLLRLIKNFTDEYSPDALTCSLLYLSKMGANITHPTLQALIGTCEEKLALFPLTALSRYTVAVNNGEISTVSFMQPVLPIVLEHLKTCQDADEFRLLTICLSNMHQLISPLTIASYKEKVLNFLVTGVLGPHSSRSVVKAISFLDFPRWSMDNIVEVRQLMNCLCGHVKDLKIGDIVSLHRAFQSHLEPVQLLQEIQEYMLQLFKNSDASFLPLDILACVVPFSAKTHNKLFEDILEVHIKSPSFSTTMPIIFKILRYLKTANVHLCDLFWDRTLQTIKTLHYDDFKLLIIAHRYMHFNNNLGGTYRHSELEDYLIHYLLKAADDVSGMIPSKLARLAAFIIGYKRRDIPSKLIDKIQSTNLQFSILDCLNISKGLLIATELGSKRHRGQKIVNQLVAVDSTLSSCTRHHLSLPKITLMEVNMLMRTYINMRGVSGTDLFEMLLDNYNSAVHQSHMSSRLIRENTFNLMPLRCLIPSVIDIMADYIKDHGHNMLGETVEKLLLLCYWVGYIPTDADTFLESAATAILRDTEKMSSLAVLQAALSLCFMQRLPVALIHVIFTVDFLDRLDQELRVCYSKVTYPMRVRQILMELNRAVCLDYPQTDVPWFHTKYCEEIAVQESASVSQFHTEVMSVVSKVVGGEEYIRRDTYSPYFYKIDFEILLDEQKKPIVARKSHDISDRQVTKVAVILLRQDATSMGKVQLRGPALLRRRHLEMLGYQQVEISFSLWHAMYMTEEGAREAFIQRHVWPGVLNNSNPSSNLEDALPI